MQKGASVHDCIAILASIFPDHNLVQDGSDIDIDIDIAIRYTTIYSIVCAEQGDRIPSNLLLAIIE